MPDITEDYQFAEELPVKTAETLDGTENFVMFDDESGKQTSLSELTEYLNDTLDAGINDDVKEALLNCFQHVAWVDNQGMNYYNALVHALYPRELVSISAVFDPQEATIYTENTLDDLMQFFTVTATYDDTSTEVVTDYTLSGDLVGGTSTITVSYNGKTTTASVTVIDLHNTWIFEMGDNMQIVTGSVDPNSSAYPSNTLFREDVPSRRNFNINDGILAYDDYSTHLPTQYFPIPIPAGANRVKIDIEPSGRYVYMTTIKYEHDSNRYSNHISSNRVTWTEVTSNGVTKDLVENDGHLFMNMNSKYDSAGTSYPYNPTKVTITFSEV